ncbi:ParB/RepB/Spo0J family partition protein [Methylocystis sp. IM4]|uniref:ParB/RepB/Spo0J family partition protein n=1 Tax=Methylocystis sp. IM4 TaxID=3136560 RepID=UPI0031196466
MELRKVDPRDLKPNPDNPRRVAAGEHADQQLVANIKAIGITQPPIVRCEGDALMIIAGERRVRAAIAAGLPEIVVLVREANDGSDSVRSLSENVVRAQMSAVDQWRAIEALASDNWTEEAIGAALALPIRTIKKLRLLAHIHPAILDHIARGDMPQENNLRTIAAASADEQASVWKKHKPKKGQPTVHWWELARALEKRRLYAKEAKFGPDEEQAFGIVWQEDLFEQGDEDTRYTTQVDAFFAAQTAWLEANLPKNGAILQIDDYGRAKLPPKAEQVWGQRKKSDIIGTYVNPRDGSIDELVYRLPERAAKKGKNDPASVDAETGSEAAKVRPEITQKGLAMIGDFRSDALAKALTENKIDDFTLLGLMILAFGAENVSVKSSDYSSERRQILQRLTEDGRLTLDPELIRKAAREMLTHVLSCRPGFHSSGIAALFVGDAIGADAHLPNMGTEEFLSCLSKSGVEKAAAATSVLPRPRAKDTRAALIEHIGEGTLILPAARFAPTEVELSAHLKPIVSYDFEGNEDDNDDDTIESASDGDDEESIESESFVDESLVEEC